MYSYDIIDCPDRETWIRERGKGIGGSDAAAIIGRNPYMSNIDLWEIKTGCRTPVDISDKPYVQYGVRAEENIRALFALDYPEYSIEHHDNRILRSKQYPFLQASLDGELFDHEGRRGVLEIKTSNIITGTQREKWNDRIPDNYYIQVLHYLLVTGYDFAVLRAHLISVWGADVRTQVKHYFIEQTAVKDDLDYLLHEEIKFWGYVEAGRKPPLVLPAI